MVDGQCGDGGIKGDVRQGLSVITELAGYFLDAVKSFAGNVQHFISHIHQDIFGIGAALIPKGS